jgi:predicted GNAT family acetyltransferase
MGKCKITRITCRDDRPDENYDSLELETGIEIEMEHTGDRDIAKHIAKDHLDEFGDYYSNLVEMEHKLKNRTVSVEDADGSVQGKSCDGGVCETCTGM